MLHAKALPGNPYDGHTLPTVIPDIERTTGATSTIIADAGHRGHAAPYDMRVDTSGQKRRMTPMIRRQMKCRSAVQPAMAT